MSRMVSIVLLAACAHRAADPQSAPKATPAPVKEVLVGVPLDLAARSAELLGVTCPAGTKLIERVTRTQRLDVHRHCELPDGTMEGPIVDFSSNGTTSSLWRRGQHRGLRHGSFLRIDYASVIELQFSDGHAVGAFRRRQLQTGIVTIRGGYDERGRLDGEWAFFEPDTGRELSRSTMVHGTGTFELWDASVNAVYPDVLLWRAQCVDGWWDGEVSFRQLVWPASDEKRIRLVSASFRAGIADGPWKAIRIADGKVMEAGVYQQGRAIGDWAMTADELCLRYERGGDVEQCASPAHDVPYSCHAGDRCKLASAAGPDEGVALPGPSEHATRGAFGRCDLPETSFSF